MLQSAELLAWEMHQEALASIMPPERLSVSEYAERRRFLPGRDRWRNARTPYLVEPMDSLDMVPTYNCVCIVGPGQVAKTVGAENWLLKSVAIDPAKFLWYMQSDDALESYVKDRINPMMDEHDELSSLKGPRPIDDSLHYKRFRGMSAEFLTASHANLINKNAPRIVADEIDNWAIKGDVKPLLDVRRQAYGDASMMMMISHPDRARGMVPETDWDNGIMAVYKDSTRCIWYWKCPKCGSYSSPAPNAARQMSLEYPSEGTLDEIEAGAYLLCPNGCKVKERDRLAMNATGVWVGEGQEISPDGRVRGTRVPRKIAGFWIQGAMSPFILGGIGGLARAYVKAERELENTGEPESLKQVTVKQLGIPYAPKRAVGSVSAHELALRTDPSLWLGKVPAGVRFLTVGVDVQLSYFEWLVRGWGEHGESWVIAHDRKLAEPATNSDDWDWLLELFATQWPLDDGSGRTMEARGAGFDTGGAAGVAQKAYEAWRRWRGKGKVALYGKIAEREVWSIIPLKGANGLNAQRLQISYPDTPRKANRLAARGDVPVGLFNPNLFKDDLAGQLMKAEPGRWYVHFPKSGGRYELGVLNREPPHSFFEQLTAEARKPNGRWEKISPHMRNEVLDLHVMTHVVAHLNGLNRINWEKPPTWARPWDQNSLVIGAKAPVGDGKTVGGQLKSGGAVKVTIDQASKKTISNKLA